MNIAEEKDALRELVRAKRKAIAPESRKELEASLEDRLLNLPAFRHAKCIAAYNPVGSEAHYVSNIEKLFTLDQHPVIAFPMISTKQSMYFLSFDLNDNRAILADPLTPRDEYNNGRFVELKDIDLMLVPGIAFDKHGNRLGQGGGFYDKCLPHLSNECLTVGIAFDEQIVDMVPHEFSDIAVDYILTPTRIISAEK